MGDAQIEVRGLPRLQSSLHRLGGDLADIAPPDAAQTIGREARARAPKRTGRLASSFSSTASNGVLKVAFGTPYAGPINFGVGARTGMRGPHNIRATRFLTGAIHDKESAWMRDYGNAAQDAANRVKGA